MFVVGDNVHAENFSFVSDAQVMTGVDASVVSGEE